MKLAYYPGCTASQTSIEYNDSVKETTQKLGIELSEISDWTCCGASSCHVINRDLALALPCQNMVRANEMALGIMTPCPACSLRFQKAEYILKKDPSLKSKIEKDIGKPLDLVRRSKHILEVLYKDIGMDAIAKQVQKPLKHLKVVTYYGCYIVRPHEVTEFDDTDNPISMDEIMKTIGVEVLEWSYKVDCCGGSASIPDTEVVRRLSNKIIKAAIDTGADAIVVACPMCHANLDMFQRRNGSCEPLPIFYFSELTALSFGSQLVREYMVKHVIDPTPLLSTLDFL